MATRSLVNNGGVDYASTNPSTPLVQPQEAISPGDSSSPQSQAADVQAADLPDNSERLIEDQQNSGKVHSAWVMVERNYRYRHLATGEIFTHYWKRPEKPGPSSDDILKGWDAKLRGEDEEKQFDVAASYGDVSRHCQGQLDDGYLKYKISNPAKSCPREWHTTKHPKITEEEMQKYLADIHADATKPAEATLLANGGQRLSVDTEDIDVNKMSGVLLITDSDKAPINRLIVDSPNASRMSFFIAFYFLLQTLHTDEATKELAQQVQGLYWMSARGDYDGNVWPGHQYNIACDRQRSTLCFGFAQYPNSHPVQRGRY